MGERATAHRELLHARRGCRHDQTIARGHELDTVLDGNAGNRLQRLVVTDERTIDEGVDIIGDAYRGAYRLARDATQTTCSVLIAPIEQGEPVLSPNENRVPPRYGATQTFNDESRLKTRTTRLRDVENRDSQRVSRQHPRATIAQPRPY